VEELKHQLLSEVLFLDDRLACMNAPQGVEKGWRGKIE
jgi:hypothetical protein